MYIRHSFLLLGLSALLTVHGAPNCAHYSFSIGNIKATVISDGVGMMNVSSALPEVHPEALNHALETNFLPLQQELLSYYNPLHLDMGDRKVMVDVGSANTFGPTLGKLLENMAAAGLDPNAVTDILITHSHLDHIGGVLKPDGSLAFPNAKVYVSKVDYEFWNSAEAEDLQDDFPLETRQHFVDVARNSLDAVSENLELFELGAEVIPGVTSRDISGHSPGMSAFIIRDGEQSLMQASDSLIWVVASIQHPEWRVSFDIDGQTAIATRFSVLKELADSGMMFLSYHNDFPGLGHIFRRGEAYGLAPVRYQF